MSGAAGSVPRGFNPRSHVGSDPLCKETAQSIFSFNPRSHVGSDIAR